MKKIIPLLLILSFVIQLNAQIEEKLERPSKYSPWYSGKDVPVPYQGGITELQKIVKNKFIFPDSTIADSIEGKIYLRVQINDDSSASNVTVLANSCNDTYVKNEFISLLSSLEKWVPDDGKDSINDQHCYLSFSFEKTGIQVESKQRKIFTIVENQPKYPGNYEKEREFIKSNIQYPKQAKDERIDGVVYLSFVVDPDGLITGIKTLLPEDMQLGYGLEEEAMRVVKLMPKWKPGTQANTKVHVRMTYPISFAME